jgi:purine-nucleoside phosphorylase
VFCDLYNIFTKKGDPMPNTRADYESAIAVIRKRTPVHPEYGLVLGSGLGELADTLEDRVVIPYGEIPNWPQATVPGHRGQLVVGKLEGKAIVAQQGRAHFYEGYTLQQTTFPIRVMHFMGVRTVILTNAAGGQNPDFKAGDVMLLKHHINLPGMTGHNP